MSRTPGPPPLRTNPFPASMKDRITMIEDLDKDYKEAKTIRGQRKRRAALLQVAERYKKAGMKERASQINYEAI